MKLSKTPGYKTIAGWLSGKDLHPFAFQQETWQHIINNTSGLVNAPTGCGKTYSVFLGSIIQFINENPKTFTTKKNNSLQLLWITPLRALAKDIGRAMEEAIAELGMQWRVGIRNGDTEVNERARQKRNMPEVLIITPESLHLFLAQKNYPEIFKTLRIIAVDEWHELLGSKRGVQVELAISRIIGCKRKFNNDINPSPLPSLWGISATIGNLDEAAEVLLAPLRNLQKKEFHSNEIVQCAIVKALLDKNIEVHSIIPDEIEKYPWAGHLGLKLVDKVVEVIEQHTTTLVFINTRGMSERWYQNLLDAAPQLAGIIALHHGSIEQELRLWVEDSLHTKKLKAVVCTASLDLGVDFRPVDAVIQVGSPKGVSRFLQRAGRSGHTPGETSKIYFLPTHSLELVEAAALKRAISQKVVEGRQPMMLCFDVLAQFLCTLSIGEGFFGDEIFEEVRTTHCFCDITKEDFTQLLFQITEGGKALQQYDEYKKVEQEENGLFRMKSKRFALRHRMHIGTIVSDSMMKVKFLSGGYVGVIEESFISRLEPGDVFTLAGRNLELIMVKDMTVIVRISTAKKKAIVPSWMGGRMSLTANLGHILRQTMGSIVTGEYAERELKTLEGLFALQQRLSKVPSANQLLIEQIEDRDGWHLMVYPFEGRQVHEAMSAILAYRIGQLLPITFSLAMNDYGFELLSDIPIPLDDANVYELFTTDNLVTDIQRSVNSVEMAARKFRDIAVIGGLIFQGYPGEKKKARHLQASASLLFKVFSEYDTNNILLRQAYHEVFEQQMQEQRLRDALQRIQQNEILLMYPSRLTPLSFPIIVDGLSRYNLSSEKLSDRIKRMQTQLESQ